MSKFENYYEYIGEEAKIFTDDFFDELFDNIKEGDIYIHDFIDQNLHDWADNDFIYVGLLEGAEILDQSEEVETDSGLWEGQEPEDAVVTKAFFTYKNDMMNEIKSLITQRLTDELNHLNNQIDNDKNDEELMEIIDNIDGAIQNI